MAIPTVSPLVWVRIVGALLLMAALLGVGFEGGRRWVLADWNADKAERAEKEKAQLEADREASRRAAVAQRVKDNAYEAEIRSIGDRLADALERVRDRPDRLPESAREACTGATGAQLSAGDAAFLGRLAARADALRAALARCQGDAIEGQPEPTGQVTE